MQSESSCMQSRIVKIEELVDAYDGISKSSCEQSHNQTHCEYINISSQDSV